MATIQEATRLAHEAVRADSEGRLAEAERRYREAAEGLREVCRTSNEAKQSQLTPHIQHYSTRADEIRLQLQPPPPQQDNDVEVVTSGSVDPSALQQLMDMGFSSEQSFNALMRFDNNVSRSMEWLLENPEAPSVPSPRSQQTTSNPSQNPQPLQHDHSPPRSQQPTHPPLPERPTARRQEASIPPAAPRSIPVASTGGMDSHLEQPLGPVVSRGAARAEPHRVAPPASSTVGDVPSTSNSRPAPPPPPPQSEPQSEAASDTASSSARALSAVLAAAQVSETHKCRCLLFGDTRGGTCGMPAALAPPPMPAMADGSSLAGALQTSKLAWVPSPLCWSCKYMEAVSGMDAATLKKSDDEDEDEDDDDDDFLFHDALASSEPQQQQQQREQAVSQEEDGDQEVESKREARTDEPAPPLPTPEPEKGGIRGWLGHLGGALGLGHSGTDPERQELERELQMLTQLKKSYGDKPMPEPARKRRQELKRRLGHRQSIAAPSGGGGTLGQQQQLHPPTNNGGGLLPRRRSSGVADHSAVPPSSAPKNESEASKAARLRELLKAARVSETEVCQETLYSVEQGEKCGRPAALVPPPRSSTSGMAEMCGGGGGGGLAGSPELISSRLCWQCKRIEAFSM